MEKNKRTNAKRVPEMQNLHFSLTVEVKKGDEGRLEGLRPGRACEVASRNNTKNLFHAECRSFGSPAWLF